MSDEKPLEQAAAEPPEAPATPAPAAAPDADLNTLRDRHLRLAADFDNFRKRAIKERTEVWEKAQADLVLRLADVLDDLTRFALHDKAVEPLERKLWKELSALGVSRIAETGVPFDPNVHEAVTTAPAPKANADHTVGAILQTGYRFGKMLLRPARVQVLTWQGDGEGTDGPV